LFFKMPHKFLSSMNGPPNITNLDRGFHKIWNVHSGRHFAFVFCFYT
jgi:hypothetical protein